MTEYRGAWDSEAVEGFLQRQHIPIRIATQRPDESLWLVSLWYRYEDGAIECASSASAHVVDFLQASPHVAFEVSTNEIPYRGVRGNGNASVEPDSEKAVLRSLIERYLGGTDSDLAAWLLDERRSEVRIRIDPDTVYSWDYSERMATARG